MANSVGANCVTWATTVPFMAATLGGRAEGLITFSVTSCIGGTPRASSTLQLASKLWARLKNAVVCPCTSTVVAFAGVNGPLMGVAEELGWILLRPTCTVVLCCAPAGAASSRPSAAANAAERGNCFMARSPSAQ